MAETNRAKQFYRVDTAISLIAVSTLLASILAMENHGTYGSATGDCTRSYLLLTPSMTFQGNMSTNWNWHLRRASVYASQALRCCCFSRMLPAFRDVISDAWTGC